MTFPPLTTNGPTSRFGLVCPCATAASSIARWRCFWSRSVAARLLIDSWVNGTRGLSSVRVRLDTRGRVRLVRGRALAGVVALCMLVPAFAHAADVTSRGSLVIRWASNPDTCGDAGLCGRSGTLSWRPGRGSFDVSTGGTQVTYFEDPAVARSRRETDSGPRICVEATDNLIELAAAHAKGGSVLTMDKTPGLDVGRCAGPLPADFAGALPRSRPFSPSRLGRRGGTIDMRGRAPFAAGPFSGEVISSLQLRITPASTEQAVSKMGARPARIARTRPPFSVVE